jgi:hypothetical protein
METQCDNGRVMMHDEATMWAYTLRACGYRHVQVLCEPGFGHMIAFVAGAVHIAVDNVEDCLMFKRQAEYFLNGMGRGNA